MKGKTEVYVVTSGDYSDYGIDAIFSTRALAEAWIELKSGDEYSSGHNIEAWPMDSEVGAERIDVWQCGIFMDSGEIIEGPHAGSEVRVPFRGNVKQLAVPVPCYQGRKISRVESGVSEDHCLKFAAETRQAWLRENGRESGQAVVKSGTDRA